MSASLLLYYIAREGRRRVKSNCYAIPACEVDSRESGPSVGSRCAPLIYHGGPQKYPRGQQLSPTGRFGRGTGHDTTQNGEYRNKKCGARGNAVNYGGQLPARGWLLNGETGI